jgi:TM2 domain-containing membrane protein YozV
MFCPDCGQEIPDNSVTCKHCGRPLQAAAAGMIGSAGYAYPVETVSAFASKKVPAGVCGILLGSLGIHKFILGLTTPGIIMLLVTILTCGFGSIVMGPIGLIEGILYLTKSDQEFYQQYAVEKRGWF